MPADTEPAVIEIADVLNTAWEAQDHRTGGRAMLVPVVLADGSTAVLAMAHLVAARLWGALDGRDPGRLDPPPHTPESRS